MHDRFLRIYLNDHLAGSVMAIEQIEHSLDENSEGELSAFLARMLDEIRGSQAVLKEVIDRVGGVENPVKKGASWLSEKVRRAKPSGAAFGYTDLTRLEDLESLMLGTRGQLALWTTLDALPDDDRLSGLDFGRLAARAQRQHEAFEQHRMEAARRAFAARDAE